MNNDFFITGIHNVIYVGKGEYTAGEVTFESEVFHNELIFHLSGEAVVTFNSKTMESKEAMGLYAIGEILDIDGDCGGFNLQWAWSSAFCASDNILKEK